MYRGASLQVPEIYLDVVPFAKAPQRLVCSCPRQKKLEIGNAFNHFFGESAITTVPHSFHW